MEAGISILSNRCYRDHHDVTWLSPDLEQNVLAEIVFAYVPKLHSALSNLCPDRYSMEPSVPRTPSQPDRARNLSMQGRASCSPC
jgi:hypothetical protein